MPGAAEVEALARSLVQAQETSLGTEVSTHVVYPNGDLVRVNVACAEDDVVVSDLSLGSMYLAEIGVHLSPQQRQRLQQEVAHYTCEFAKGRVYRHCTHDQIADTIALVANASRSIADYGSEAKRQFDADFRVTVIERLRNLVGPRLREREPVAGRSGRPYRVGGVILDRKEVSPVAFVEAFATRSIIGDRFMAFSDLKLSFENVRMISVYDDSNNWLEPDLRVLSQVSTVVGYSKSDASFEALA
ncbi:MAG: hypothetical protein ABW003_07580 [Microvirga sp.]